MHQPLEPKPNEVSIASNDVGGTLTSDLGHKFLTENPTITPNVDQMTFMPYLRNALSEITISSSDVRNGIVVELHPFYSLTDYSANDEVHIPFQICAMRACHFYDHDVQLTFMAIKHERARGIYQFVWVPGIENLGITDVKFDTTKFHRWIWDLEKADEFTVVLQAPKYVSWRDRFPRIGNRPLGDSPHLQDTYFDGGTLLLQCLLPYNAGNVGPNEATLIILQNNINLRTAEYRQPFNNLAGEMSVLYANPVPTPAPPLK